MALHWKLVKTFTLLNNIIKETVARGKNKKIFYFCAFINKNLKKIHEKMTHAITAFKLYLLYFLSFKIPFSKRHEMNIISLFSTQFSFRKYVCKFSSLF